MTADTEGCGGPELLHPGIYKWFFLRFTSREQQGHEQSVILLVDQDGEGVGRLVSWSGLKEKNVVFCYVGGGSVGDARTCVETGLKSVREEHLSDMLSQEVDNVQSGVPLWQYHEDTVHHEQASQPAGRRRVKVEKEAKATEPKPKGRPRGKNAPRAPPAKKSAEPEHEAPPEEARAEEPTQTPAAVPAPAERQAAGRERVADKGQRRVVLEKKKKKSGWPVDSDSEGAHSPGDTSGSSGRVPRKRSLSPAAELQRRLDTTQRSEARSQGSQGHSEQRSQSSLNWYSEKRPRRDRSPTPPRRPPARQPPRRQEPPRRQFYGPRGRR